MYTGHDSRSGDREREYKRLGGGEGAGLVDEEKRRVRHSGRIRASAWWVPGNQCGWDGVRVGE